jgi:hypothetical protein
MAPRITSTRGKPDKLMRDALVIELRAEAEDAQGVPTKKLRLLARKLIDLGLDGDLAAIKEINDRVDGKATQPIGGDEAAAPVRHVFEWKSSASSSTTSREPNSFPSTSGASASPASSPTAAPERP